METFLVYKPNILNDYGEKMDQYHEMYRLELIKSKPITIDLEKADETHFHSLITHVTKSMWLMKFHILICFSNMHI